MIIRRPIVQDCFTPEQYTSSPEIIKKCLQDALSEGMMNPQVNAPNEDEDMKKKERENIIKKHMEQYTTKYYESDRRWHSFLPDDTSPRKMKPIAKRKWEDLEKAIVEFYKAQDYSEKRKRLTLRTLFPEWFAYKWNDTNKCDMNMGFVNPETGKFLHNNTGGSLTDESQKGFAFDGQWHVCKNAFSMFV